MITALVVFISILVMIGWQFDIDAFKNILPYWVTMKVSTAFAFFLSGITLFFVAKATEKDITYAEVVLPGTTLALLLLMATLLMSNIFGIDTGIEEVFVKESAGAVNTTIPGRPSVGTMINFILIALSGIITLYKPQQLKLILFIIGWIVVVSGSLALIGYIINVPLLYYRVEAWSSAMAIHTACLFILLGAGLVILYKTDYSSGGRP